MATNGEFYPLHDLARIFPAQTPEEFAEMKASIAKIGQMQPITVWQGQIIDGSHRYQACLELGKPPVYQFLEDDIDPVAFVVSANINRRHLDVSQRAIIGYRLSSESGNDDLNQQEAAQLLGVSNDLIRRAGKVLQAQSPATPELREAVESGVVKVTDAVKVVNESEQVQREVVEKVKSGEAKTASKAVQEVKRKEAREKAMATLEQVALETPEMDWTYVNGAQGPAPLSMLEELENGKNVIGTTDAIDLLQALPDSSIDLLLTDIPYARVNKPSGGLRIIDKKDANEETFDLDEFANEVFRVTKCNAIIFCGKEQFSPLYQHFDDQGVTTRMIVWEKTNPSPMNASVMFLSGVECAVHFRKDKATFNQQYQNTVFRFPNGSSLRHPTEKPLDMFKWFVEALSNPEDLVCDPCMGSGTAAVAAYQLGRRFLCGDINPENGKVAVLRLLEGN